MQGHLRGKEQEIAFRNLLGEQGIVRLRKDKTYSVGRKWRSALNKLGFLFPKIPVASGCKQSEIGPVNMITANGWRLIQANTVPAMQECFLRALAAYTLPSTLERKFKFSVFSPLKHTLAVMLELEKQTGESRLDFIEMALIVQLTNGDDDLVKIVSQIRNLRALRRTAPNRRLFDQEQYAAAAALHPYVKRTFNDYADTNFRYLKATGLVQGKGSGLSLTPEKRALVKKLIQEFHFPDSNRLYFVTLCNGATLPTDHKNSALAVLDDLLRQLKQREIPFNTTGKPIHTPADIAVLRHQVEALLLERNEEEYAARQAREWQEIAAYMELIIHPRSKKALSNGQEIGIPKTETPAYFEWVLWRAFLAINSLLNKLFDARRFKIDQDFLPVCTAPGNGPDLIFEFDNYVTAVEVTLTGNSRQEAAEGEPVRRHVADLAVHYAERSGKPVYGLFIANRIDSNTAETFRIGVWYTQNDDKMQLNIVPMTLIQFKGFFEALFQSGKTDAARVRTLLDRCGGLRSAHETPAWKRGIERVIQQTIQSILIN